MNNGDRITGEVPLLLNEFRSLFVDSSVIDRMDGVVRVVNQARKHPANPLVEIDRTWEGFQVGGFASVLYDNEESLFKMWYSAYPRPEPALMCYTFSQDGIEWEKPALGMMERDGSRENNCVPGLRNLSTILTPRDPDRRKRFKAFFHRRGTFSPDGIHWDTLGSEDIPGPIAGDNVITACYDHLTDRYVAAVKINTGSPPCRRRSVAISLSRDFVTWPEPETVLEPDSLDDGLNRSRIEAERDQVAYIGDPRWQIAQFYGMIPFPYEGMYLGMLQVLDVSAPHPVTGNNDSELTVGGGGEDGLIHIQLAGSRNLHDWDRVCDREMFLLSGRSGSWDAHTVFTCCPPIIVGREIWIYYTSEGVSHCSPWYSVFDERHGHEKDSSAGDKDQWYLENPGKTPLVFRIGTKGPTSGVGLARLRIDGWVSVNAGKDRGTFTTKPLIFAPGKRRLVINAEVREGGSVTVEILDRAGVPLAGFGRADCYAFEHDSLRHTVVWDGKNDVSHLAGKTIRLRFYMKNAAIYSFVFKKEE